MKTEIKTEIMSKFTDIELLERIKKNGDSASKLILWNRYQGLIHKDYNSHLSFYRLVCENFNDFHQDAYIYFEKAIDKIDIERMKKRNCKSFITIFYLYLRKLRNSFQKQMHDFGIPIYTSSFQVTDVSENDSMAFSQQALDFNKKTSTNFIDQLKKKYETDLINDYIESLQNDNIKKTILIYYLAGLKLSEISRALEMNYSKIYSNFSEIKNDLIIANNTKAII